MCILYLFISPGSLHGLLWALVCMFIDCFDVVKINGCIKKKQIKNTVNSLFCLHGAHCHFAVTYSHEL